MRALPETYRITVYPADVEGYSSVSRHRSDLSLHHAAGLERARHRIIRAPSTAATGSGEEG
jgi:hypothetical protein